MQKSNESLIESLGEIKPDLDPANFSNPEEMFSNMPELNNINFDSIFDSMFAPLSFYRQVIKRTTKDFKLHRSKRYRSSHRFGSIKNKRYCKRFREQDLKL